MSRSVILRLSYAPHAGHAPAFVARARGYFEAEGLAVTIEPGLGSSHTVDCVASGQAHFGTVDAFAAMSAWLRGAPIVSLFVELQSSLLGLVARVGAGVETPFDLRGRRLGIIPRSTTAIAARAIIGRLGLREEDVHLVELAPGGELERLGRAEIDALVAALTNEYVVWTLRRPDLRLRAWPLTALGIDVYGHVLVTSEALRSQHPGLASGFVRALRHGWREALADPEGAAAILAREIPGLDPESETAKFRAVAGLTHGSDGATLGEQSLEKWGRLAGLLQAYGGLPDRDGLEALVRRGSADAEAGARHAGT